MAERIFTLTEARKLLPKIKAITEQYHDRVEEIHEAISDETSESKRAELARQAEQIMQKWSREILALGVEPKGLWLCDFDSGDGFYFCWQFGEDDIEYIHGYEAGFSGRRKIMWK